MKRTALHAALAAMALSCLCAMTCELPGEEDFSDGVTFVASDAEAGDEFGKSVAIWGDYAIVGARTEDTEGTDAGAAYVFHRTGDDSWDAGVKLIAPDAEADDLFGSSVSIDTTEDGSYAIVGAEWEDEGGSNAGAAYVFHRTGTNSWDNGVKLVAPDAEADDRFGSSVSIFGSYAIVGAFGEDEGGDQAGAAYVFHRTGTNIWDPGVKLVAPDAEAQDYFGGSVWISWDYAIVGAPYESSGGASAGAAYVFHSTGTNSWDAGVKLVAPDLEAGDVFGSSVSMFGEYAIVGAPLEDSAGGTDAGAAYVFYRTGTSTWDAGVKLIGWDPEAEDHFGNSVSIYVDYAVVGTRYEDTGGDRAGAAYVFERTGTNSWEFLESLLAPDAQAEDEFGTSVSISGDIVIVGAPGEDTGGTNAGAAYIFY